MTPVAQLVAVYLRASGRQQPIVGHVNAETLSHSLVCEPYQVNSEALRKACPIPFHEGKLWKSADAADLRRQLQTHFRNITSIMDCVGCEKCKMWGKLQLLGAASTGSNPDLL